MLLQGVLPEPSLGEKQLNSQPSTCSIFLLMGAGPGEQ